MPVYSASTIPTGAFLHLPYELTVKFALFRLELYMLSQKRLTLPN